MVISMALLFPDGRAPDFHNSMKADPSRELFDMFVGKMRNSYVPDRIHS